MAILSNPEHPILLVDDEPHTLESFAIALDYLGVDKVIKCGDETTVMEILAQQEIEHKKKFETRWQAFSDGFSPCRHCRP